MATLKEIETSEPQADIINSNKEFNLFLAGVGSGKSHTMGIKSGEFIINFPSAYGIICANTYEQLSRSTLVQIKKVWASNYGLIEDTHYVIDKQPLDGWRSTGEKLKTYRNVISFQNGCRVYLASLDNYKAVDGLEVSWALLDETKDTKEEAVKETILARLRQNKIWITKDKTELLDHIPQDEEVDGFNPLYIFTSPAKVQWLNDMFYINENLDQILSVIFKTDPLDYYVGDFNDRRVVISSSYHNQENLPSNYISSRRAIWDETPGLTDMLIFASPVGKTGGEWYANYNREIHIKPQTVDSDLPLHVTFDFNVNPYMPALAIQIDYNENETVIRVLKEYALAHPRNTTADVCDELIFDFAGIAKSMYIYGDASGRNRTTATMDKSIRHNYDVIQAKLIEYLFPESMRVPSKNPPLSGRRILMNRIFAANTYVRIEIDPSCVNLINDIDFGKEGANGEYLKPKFKDDDGRTYEKYGHHSDALIYFCWYNFFNLINLQ